MKKCIVIGSCGYIGKHIVWYLAQMGIEAECYDVKAFNEDQEHYHHIDMTDYESVEKINFDVDYIFMFAGLTGTYAGFDAYARYVDINEIALLNLLTAIRKSSYRPKIIFPSSRLVYKGCDMALDEGSEKETNTIYAVNKLACEGYLQAYSKSFGIPYTIFRICVPYGNLLDEDYSFGTVGFFIKTASSGNNITLYGGGTVKRTFTHMYDICNQMINGAFKSESTNQIFNIGGETYSLHDAAQIFAKKYGVSVVAVPWPEKDAKIESGHTYFDDSKIKSLFGGYSYKSINSLL